MVLYALQELRLRGIEEPIIAEVGDENSPPFHAFPAPTTAEHMPREPCVPFQIAFVTIVKVLRSTFHDGESTSHGQMSDDRMEAVFQEATRKARAIVSGQPSWTWL